MTVVESLIAFNLFGVGCAAIFGLCFIFVWLMDNL